MLQMVNFKLILKKNYIAQILELFAYTVFIYII